MKNLTYGLIALTLLLLIVFTIQGCNKDSLAAIPDGKLVASKYTLNTNQPDTLLLKGALSTDSIKWSVNPALATSFSLATKHNAGLIVFATAGTYTVSVSDNGATPVSVTITVNAVATSQPLHPTPSPGGDTVATPKTPVTYTQLPLTGDEIALVPHFHNNPSADSSYLSFVAQTKNYYCGTSTLVTSYSLDNSSNYTIGFLNVSQPSPCVIGNSPIAAVINFTQNPGNNMPNGTFPLSVTLNGTTYTGSIVATSTTITFNWNYTSGVTISPKSVAR